MAPANILVVNGGSSSIKVDFFGAHRSETFSVVASLIQMAGSRLEIRDGRSKASIEINPNLNYQEVGELVFAQIVKRGLEVHGVGHRIVHGGPLFERPILINNETLGELDSLVIFDKLHMVPSMELVRLSMQDFPNALQVACFDTSYFKDLPAWSQALAIPHELAQKGYRKYGFHGLAYESLTQQFRRICGDDAAMGRVLYMHLGSGASVTAVSGDHPIDTSMVMSTNSGVMMSTRSGSIDPGVIELLHEKDGYNYQDIFTMLACESGLRGVSGYSADMYELINASEHNERASLAVEKFIHDVAMTAGSMTVAMGGLDSIVFSGGIGENSAPIRERICDKLMHLGVVIDVGRNRRSERYIGADQSKVGIHVIGAKESLVIAQHTHELYQNYSRNH